MTHDANIAADAVADGPVVVASAALLALEAGNRGRVQLLPCGSFSARDGRPGTTHSLASWRVDAAAARALLDVWRSRATPLVVDYEHQSVHAARNGRPAPAAGWVEDLSWVPGRGLFAVVAWTGRAAAMIRAGEYRFISPAITFDRDTGRVNGIVSIALTNTPALDGMEAVALREALTEDNIRMEQELEQDPIAAPPAPSVPPASPGDAAGPVATPAPIATLTAERDAALEQLALLNGELAALKQDREAVRLSALIDAALADGRLQKTLEPWARSLAAGNPAALCQFLGQVRPLAALSGMQTEALTAAAAPSAAMAAALPAALADEEKAVCTALGLTAEQFQQEKGTIQ